MLLALALWLGLLAAIAAIAAWHVVPRVDRWGDDPRRAWMREHRRKRGPAPERPRRIVSPSYGAGRVWKAQWGAAKKKARAGALYRKADTMPEPPREGL